MAKLIRSYPALTTAIRDSGISTRQLRRMSKRERLDYAKDKGWEYNPPSNFGTNVETTAHIQQSQLVRNSQGKIVGKISTPDKTYEERVTQPSNIKGGKSKLQKDIERVQTGKLKTSTGFATYGNELATGRAASILQSRERQQQSFYTGGSPQSIDPTAVKRQIQRQKEYKLDVELYKQKSQDLFSSGLTGYKLQDETDRVNLLGSKISKKYDVQVWGIDKPLTATQKVTKRNQNILPGKTNKRSFFSKTMNVVDVYGQIPLDATMDFGKTIKRGSSKILDYPTNIGGATFEEKHKTKIFKDKDVITTVALPVGYSAFSVAPKITGAVYGGMTVKQTYDTVKFPSTENIGATSLMATPILIKSYGMGKTKVRTEIFNRKVALKSTEKGSPWKLETDYSKIPKSIRKNINSIDIVKAKKIIPPKGAVYVESFRRVGNNPVMGVVKPSGIYQTSLKGKASIITPTPRRNFLQEDFKFKAREIYKYDTKQRKITKYGAKHPFNTKEQRLLNVRLRSHTGTPNIGVDLKPTQQSTFTTTITRPPKVSTIYATGKISSLSDMFGLFSVKKGSLGLISRSSGNLFNIMSKPKAKGLLKPSKSILNQPRIKPSQGKIRIYLDNQIQSKNKYSTKKKSILGISSASSLSISQTTEIRQIIGKIPRTKIRTTPKTVITPTTTTTTKTRQRYRGITPTIPGWDGGRTTLPPPPKPPKGSSFIGDTPLGPPPKPLFDFEPTPKKQTSKSSFVVSAFNPGYLPSVEAMAFGIKGSKPLDFKTGIGLRPILTKKRRGKKRK